MVRQTASGRLEGIVAIRVVLHFGEPAPGEWLDAAKEVARLLVVVRTRPTASIGVAVVTAGPGGDQARVNPIATNQVPLEQRNGNRTVRTRAGERQKKTRDLTNEDASAGSRHTGARAEMGVE
jgi:hypothetical protein